MPRTANLTDGAHSIVCGVASVYRSDKTSAREVPIIGFYGEKCAGIQDALEGVCTKV